MQFEDIKNDNLSGAAEILQNTAACWLREIQNNRAPNLQMSLDALRRRGLEIIAMHPRMAPLFNLVNSVLCAGEAAKSVDHLRQKAEQAIRNVLDQLETASAQLIRLADDLIPPAAKVLTYSKSSIIMSLFFDLHKRHKTFQALLCESRPMLEGQKAASELAQSGISATLFVDAAMGLAVQECDIVLVGADSFSEAGVVNKIGTWALALLAREANKPIYCLAPMLKYLPQAQARPDKMHSIKEVWPETPPGVQIVNRYFENTPIELFTKVLTEEGFFREIRAQAGREKHSSWLLHHLAPAATP